MIKRPIITEKSISQYQDENKVTFEVALNTDKRSAAKELEEVFEVNVEGVKVINRLGKKRVNRLTRQIQRKTRDKKIMIFKLKDGDKIDTFEQAQDS